MTVLALAVGGRGLVDPHEPVLHADDEAFLRGRGAFETIRVYNGRPFRLDDHLERLAASSERLDLPQIDTNTFRALAGEAIGAAGEGDVVLRLYLTPGREGEGRPTALAMVSTIPAVLEERRTTGMRMITVPLGLDPNLRAEAPWLLGGVKSTSYAVNMAAEAEARRRGADDAVFLAAGRIVLEGPVTNVWWRSKRELFTPALDLGILAGVTRSTLLEQAADLGYEVREGAYPVEELAAADEAFTSSSVREVMPVIELDGALIGAGAPGPAAGELQAALRRAAGP
ncbi:MAG TPA: aminotransferase class IV [Gaiellaceae bacterium]|nr:aminotransferase class IV [Gaiellaceae bacterium]